MKKLALFLTVLMFVSACSDTGLEAGPEPEPAAPTASATTVPEDYETIFGELQKDAMAFVSDPLNESSESILCRQTTQCIELRNNALEGTRWEGVNEDNVIVESVQVLEEFSDINVDLLVNIRTVEPVKLQRPDKSVVEENHNSDGAKHRVTIFKEDGEWKLSKVVFGQTKEADRQGGASGVALFDPLDETLEALGELRSNPDGSEWQIFSNETDDFCIRATVSDLDSMLVCAADSRASDSSFIYKMRTEPIGLTDQWITVWFAAERMDFGLAISEAGTEQRISFVDVDGPFKVGVAIVNFRPERIDSLRGGERQDKPIDFNWPKPLSENN